MSRHHRAQRVENQRNGNHAARAAERFAAGDHVAAEKHCRRALAQTPRHAEMWHLLAAAQFSQGNGSAARQAVTRARALAPTDADYANTEALIMEQLGETLAAEAAWRALLARDPTHADAWYNLGRQLLARGAAADARDCFVHALELRPHWADACRNLGAAAFASGDRDTATRAYIAALRVDPEDVDSCLNLARLREEADDFDGAFGLYRNALARRVDAATLLRFALLAPIFADDPAAIATHRQRIAGNLAALATAPLALDSPVETLGTPTFYLAYHGADDRPLMSAVGDLVARAWRPAPLPARPRPARPRIVFVSAHFKAHTIGRLYAPLLERLPRDGYELGVLSLGRHEDALAGRIAAAVEHAVAVPPDLAAARRALAELSPTVVVYCDLGMEPVSLYLAAERFAPVQCMTWGHPVTSGLPTVDRFISSTYIEPVDGADHYRETLVALPAWPVLYDAPEVPAIARAEARRQFGFAADERVYLCPQSLFKLHPEFDGWLAGILRRDPRGVVVLLSPRADWQARLCARYARTLGDASARVRFLPAVSATAFKTLLGAADVVLDTPHFSGGYTTFETLWAETPFVTTRGRYMRGRVSAGLCDLLGLAQPIADDGADYVERAVAFANDPTQRAELVAAIAARKAALLALDASVLPAYRALFLDTLAAAGA